MARSPHRRRRFGLALLATMALAAPTAMAAISTSATAEDPAPGAETIELSVPAKQVVYAEGKRIYSDLGVRLIAEGGDFQLNLNRDPAAPYTNGITVTRILDDGSTVDLGQDLTKSLGGLDKFLTMKFTPVKNNVAKPFTKKVNGCIGQSAERVHPDAAPRSPFPKYCYYNPYSLGAVQGIAEGYAASVGDPWGSMKVGKGAWDVTISIAPKWAAALGLDPAASVATTRLKVKTYDECMRAGRGCRAGKPDQGTDKTALRPAKLDPRGMVDSKDDIPADYPKPDLRSLPAWGIQLSRNGKFLQFSATVWNAGDTPMVVDGFRSSPGLMDGYQYFFDADGEQLPEYAKIGTFEWDPKPTHLHWHFRSFAAYSLLPDKPGVVPTPGLDDGHQHEHEVDSRKEAFCLANTDAVDLTGAGAQWNVDNSDLSTACGDYSSLSIREVLAAGWGDTYAQFRAGQSFKIVDLPKGCYNIWVQGNPEVAAGSTDRTMLESDYTNNDSKRQVCIGGKPGGPRTIKSIEKIGNVDEAMGDFLGR